MAAKKELSACHLYINNPSMRLERELKEMTGEGFNGDCSLDALALTSIDSMHYCGTDSTDAMLRRFPPPCIDDEASPALPTLKVLDLGSGFGGCARYVGTKLPGAAVTGLELQPELNACAAGLTARCGEDLVARVSHVCGDMLELGTGGGGGDAPDSPPLPSWGRYDVVFSKLVVLHIPFGERPKLWRNVARCGRAGGLLYLEDYFAAAPLEAQEARDLLQVVGCPTLPSQGEYVGQLEAAGFTEVEFQDASKAWGAFVADRAAQYAANEARHLKVHGAATVESMGAFYRCTAGLFAGGRLGGAIITARFPEAAR